MVRLLLLALALLPVTGCTVSGGQAHRQAETNASLPSTCGSDYVTATVGDTTQPLAGCDATVGRQPPPVIRVKVGDVVRLDGSNAAGLVVSSTHPTIAAVDGLRVRALKSGTANVVLERGAFCSPPVPPHEEPQPKRCVLLTVAVRE